jgi:ABC-type dipeptide/oligopeptide/nickel transport system permease subunit
VTAPDKSTVRFELSSPASAFIPNLAAMTMFNILGDALRDLLDPRLRGQ